MKDWKKGMVWVICALFAGMTGSGCALFVVAGAGASVGVGAAQYIRGELKQAYAAPIEKAWNAALATAEDLKMRPTEKSTDNIDQNREIKGKTDEGRDFQIAFEAMSKDVTMVKVRIGVFGDEAYSKKIQERIAAHLKK